MKIILSVESIAYPLTGIGRYTYELAMALQRSSEVTDLRLFSRGRWIDSMDTAAAFNQFLVSTAKSISQQALLRRIYGMVIPAFLKYRLEPYNDYIFHSPNYVLPQCASPTVATFHDMSVFRYPEFHPPDRVEHMKRLIPDTLRRADFLLTDSEHIRREVIDYFSWPEDRIRAVPLGVSRSYEPLSEKKTANVLSARGLRHGGYAICIATIEPRKNIIGLINAYALLPESLRRRYPLVLVGHSGWNSEAIHERIRQASAEGWLHYAGYLPDEEARALLAGARGFVFPSWYEGFGLPLLEAMASGVPVISSKTSSMPEVGGDAVGYFAPCDPPEMRDALLRLLEDDDWCINASQKGLERTRQFTWDETARNTIEAYRAVHQSVNAH